MNKIKKKREADKRYKDKQRQKLKEVNNINDDFYCISIIIKSKNIVPIKDITSILKINDHKNDFS